MFLLKLPILLFKTISISIVSVIITIFLFLTFFLLQINSTILNPDYIGDTFEENQIPNFLLVELPKSIIEEAKSIPDDSKYSRDQKNILNDSGLTTEDYVNVLTALIPPELLQETISNNSSQLVDYLTGGSDEFELTVSLKDRIPILKNEIILLINKSEYYNLLFERGIDPYIDTTLERQELPLGLELTSEELSEFLQKVIPEDWVNSQIDDTLSSITPYATKDSETFTIKLILSPIIENSLTETKILLAKKDAYSILYDEVIGPKVSQTIGEKLDLPIGIEIPDEKITEALRSVAPEEWVQEEVEKILDDVSKYLNGEIDEFKIELSLEDNKELAKENISSLVKEDLDKLTNNLPVCNNNEIFSLTSLTSLPKCIPDNLIPKQVYNVLDNQIDTNVDTILSNTPNSIEFTQESLKESLGISTTNTEDEFIESARDKIKNGWIYTDKDLKRHLNQKFGVWGTDTLEQSRNILSDGLTYNNIDLEKDMAKVVDENTISLFNDGRNYVASMKKFRFVIYVPIFILMLVSSLILFRTWTKRIRLMAIYLIIGSFIILASLNVGYYVVAKSIIEDTKTEAISNIAIDENFKSTTELTINKSINTVENISDNFINGISAKALICLILGGLILGGSIIWSIIGYILNNIWNKLFKNNKNPEPDDEPEPNDAPEPDDEPEPDDAPEPDDEPEPNDAPEPDDAPESDDQYTRR